jgi:hypothetical protein
MIDKPKIKRKRSETVYKYKYFKYMYKIRKLNGKIPQYEEKYEESLFSDTSSDSDLDSLDSDSE